MSGGEYAGEGNRGVSPLMRNRANLGRPRQMAIGQYIHRSVKQRLQYEEDKYHRQKERQRTLHGNRDGRLPGGRADGLNHAQHTWSVGRKVISEKCRTHAREIEGKIRSHDKTHAATEAGIPEAEAGVLGYEYGAGKKLRGPLASLPPEWGTSWRGLLRGDMDVIWEG